MTSRRRYFDWAATAVPDNIAGPERADIPFGNPSSLHEEGKKARQVLEEARAHCARTLGVKPEELVFTSGGTESNALILFSLLLKPRRKGGENAGAELLYSGGEHSSVRENCEALRRLGVPAAAIALEKDGRVSEASLEAALKKNPAPRMAAVMGVNNETGAVNGIQALAVLLRRGNSGPPAHLHCDLVQGIGKIPLDLYGWGLDSAAFSAHKIGGPRGTGLLWLKKPILPLIRGGGQERKLRPGTENTSGAIALARAVETHAKRMTCEEAADRMEILMTLLRRSGAFIPIPEDRQDRDCRFSPWILQGAFRGKLGIIPGEVMVRALDEKGFAVSTGSACSSADKKRNVLEAMGIDGETALGGIRISQGWSTSREDVEALAETAAELARCL